MEHLEHLEGMLDRDQRTAKLRFFSSDKLVPKAYTFTDKGSCEPASNSIISRHCCCPSRTKRQNSSYLTWKNGYLVNNYQSLKNVLIVGVCLTLVTLPCTSSAPTNLKMTARMKEQPKWINPCGITQGGSVDVPDNVPLRDISDGELLSQIVDQAGIALNKAKEFRDEFAQKTFEMSLDDLHKMLESQSMSWLDLKLPKSLGEDVPEDHLKNLKLDDTLLNVYEYLQKVAVGLEQVVWDQEDNQGAFAGKFGDAEQQLRNVLCELQMTIIEHNLKMRVDVTRDIMTDEFRHMNITDTKTRDWMIFREYMNTLEYIMAALKQ